MIFRNMRLSELNRQISSDKLIWILAVIIFLAALILFVLYIVIFKQINSPPITPDGYQYDAIALQLSKGRGFSFNWDDPDLNEPYKDHNPSGSDVHLEERHGEGTTTYRPPLLPFLMAANYRMFGRIFWPMRVINSILLAITCVLIFIILSRRFGILPGMLGVVLFHFDPRTQYFVSLILTESPAILMVTLICWLLLKTVESKSLWAALLLGAITGFAFLLRSVFILWVPLIVIGVYLLGKSRMRSWFSPSAFRLPAIILVSFIIVVAPWMIRNSLVLGGFYPLGTMGSTSLSAAYSDEAVNNRGVWFDLSRAGFFDQLPIEKMSLLEQEKIKADYSRDVAIKWVRSNPTEIPKLAFFKISGMWKPYGKVAPIILFFAALGFLFLVFNKSRFAFSLFVFIAACTFSVAVTWTTTRDRFLIPILPILSMLAAMGIWYLAISTEKYLSERLNRLEPI